MIPVHWTWQVNMPLISGGKKIKYLPTQAMSCGLSKGGQMLAAAGRCAQRDGWGGDGGTGWGEGRECKDRFWEDLVPSLELRI